MFHNNFEIIIKFKFKIKIYRFGIAWGTLGAAEFCFH